MDQDFLNTAVLGLTVLEWGRLLLVWILGAGVLFGARRLFVGRLVTLAERTRNNLDDIAAVILKGTRSWFIVLISLYVSVTITTDEAPAFSVIQRLVLLGGLVQAGLWGNGAIGFGSDWYVNREGDQAQAQITAVRAIGLIGRILLWSVLFIVALDNFGIDITALVAGLGIGGIAIALAVQNVLQDLLAYISIVVDKPFVYGDFLILDEFAGSVEHIGIKSTRLRSLSGEQLVFSNSDLLGSRVRNFKRMYERRIAFSVGVTYDTPRETLEQIPTMLREAVEGRESIRFDRSHLKAFGASSIDFETVYFVTEPDYVVYMDRQQAINLAIHRAFESSGIEFAFPTQSIHVESVPKEMMNDE